MRSLLLGLFAAGMSVLPALAQQDPMYLDTALKAGYVIKGQSSVTYSLVVEGASALFSRVEVSVQKDKAYALCSIETNLEKRVSTELACAIFK